MPRSSQEQPDVPPFEYRAGVTMPSIGGMYRRGDPSQIPAHRLHLGVNIRLADGEAGSRPGLARVVEDEAEVGACITGIFEIQDFAVGVYITRLGTVAPFAVMAFNEEKTPPEQDYWDENATFVKKAPSPWREVTGERDAFNTFQPFNDTLLVLQGTDVYQAEFSEDESNPRLDLSLLFSLPSTAPGNIWSSCVRRERVDDPQTGDEFEKDVLYLGGEDGDIWRYDGTTLELVHTLAGGGPMQVITYSGGIGLVAAGDDGFGFSYQGQAGFAWADEAWGSAFRCHGLCEFLGQVVFVGDNAADGDFFTPDGVAMRWPGSGAPVIFVTEAGNTELVRFRTPVVSAGALHWLYERWEVGGDTFYWIARYTDFSTGSLEWADLGSEPTSEAVDGVAFFIPYAGAMLVFVRHAGPAAEWPAGDNILLVFSGATPQIDPVHNESPAWAGSGFEAIPL